MHPMVPTQIYKRNLTEIKGEVNSNTVVVGDFNIPFSIMDRSSNRWMNSIHGV